MTLPSALLLATAALIVAATGDPLPAQGGAVVIPPEWTATDAPGLDSWPFGAFDARRQLLIDAPLLGSARNRPLTALHVRRNGGDTDVLEASRIALDVELSSARGAARRAQPEFAANRGQQPVMVFSGVIDLPAAPAAPGGVAPWSPPYSVAIPFSTPFTLRGGTLCIETRTTLFVDSTGRPLQPWWPVDAFVQHEPVTVQSIGASCWQGAGPEPAGALGSTFVLGSRGVFHMAGTRGGLTTSCMIGISDQYLGSAPLPIPLDGLGAPGCALSIEPMLAILAGLEAPGAGPRFEARAELTLPPSPSIAGTPLFAQWLVGDPSANALGLATTNAVRVTIASPPAADAFAWIESTDLGSPDGRVVRGRMPVLLLEHR